MSKKIELPPPDFGNTVNQMEIEMDWNHWRRSNEWKVFIAGYNSALEKMKSEADKNINMGEHRWRLFEENQIL